MNSSEETAVRVAELERQIALLAEERADALAEGAMLKTLLQDISRRREVEQKLQQTEEWLHLAQEAGRVSAYTTDLRTGELVWSPSTMALYGFPQGERPTVERWLASIHPEDTARVEAVAEGALAHGLPVDHQFRVVRPDGSILWIKDRGRIIRDAGGTPIRLVGINIDVTELVELERRRAEGEDRLRLALDAGGHALWDWDIARNTIEWDRTLCAHVGLDDDFQGGFDTFWAMVHEDDRPKVKKALDAALAEGDLYASEFRMVRPDGSIRWCSSRANIIRDSNGVAQRLVGIDTDITDQKQGETESRRHGQFLQSVLNASSDCIKVVETDGRLTFMNGNGQCAMGITDFGSVEGRPWDSLWPSEGAELVRHAIIDARNGRSSRFESFCPTALGTPKWWEVSVAPLQDDAGGVAGIVSISRDISERHASQEQLKLLNAELHHRIKNNLAMVQALARATLNHAANPDAFEEAFSARLGALGKTHSLLQAGSDMATVGELVNTELAPFSRGAQAIRVDGPEVLLPAADAVSFGMIMHELATNAAKYGGLSRNDGDLAVSWTLRDDGNKRSLELRWQERNGFAVSAPDRSGFGSKLIGRLVSQIGGRLEREWTDEGLLVRLHVPLS